MADADETHIVAVGGQLLEKLLYKHPLTANISRCKEWRRVQHNYANSVLDDELSEDFKFKSVRGGTEDGTTVLAAAALQDHMVKSLGLGDLIGPRHIGPGPAARARQKTVRSTIDTGRFGRNHPPAQKKEVGKEKEYVLDPKPPPLSLAQKMGLVEAPTGLLTEKEWLHAKEKSNQRDDSKLPCVICKEDFGTQEQVLLSCTHVFHRSCLQAFERFTGRKTCPMCRKEQYQTRVIHEGSREYRHKCATMIQALWRGYIVRCWYRKLRETRPPQDPKLKEKFYQDKLRNITDRIVRSCDFNINQFLRDIDSDLEASRNVFRDFDAQFQQISPEEWEAIQLRAVERGETDCPICLTSLVSRSYIGKHRTKPSSSIQTNPQASQGSRSQTVPKNRTPISKSANQSTNSRRLHQKVQFNSIKNEKQTGSLPDNDSDTETENQPGIRRTVLLSCSHVFHETCLETFEELNVESTKNVCPVCRTKYQKNVLAV